MRRSGLIDPARVLAVEAGACPHTVIREDPTLNIAAGDALEAPLPRPAAHRLRVRAATIWPPPSRSTWWIGGSSSSTWPAATTSRASAAPASCAATCWWSTRPTSRRMSASTSPRMLAEADERARRPAGARHQLRRGEGIDAVADAIGRAVLFAA